MRPLPRVHAVTDHVVAATPDFRVRAAAIMAGGSSVAVHARDHQANTRSLSQLAAALLRLARPAEAAVFVNGRPDVARALRAHGVQLRGSDLSPDDARLIMPQGFIGVSVHSEDEAHRAVAAGADFLLAGSIFDTDSHPERAPAGVGLIERLSRLSCPVIAIGGITAARLPEVRDAGAYGVAAISALWNSADPSAAVAAFLEGWS